MRYRGLGWLPALMIVLLDGCGTDPPGSAYPGAGRESSRYWPPPNAPPPLELRLTVPAIARAGSAASLKLSLQNVGDEPIQLQTGLREQMFDFAITRPDGTLLWRRLQGVPIAAILYRRTLDPGEVMIFEDRWNLRDNHGRRVRRGTYQAHAILHVVGARWGTEPQSLTVIPSLLFP